MIDRRTWRRTSIIAGILALLLLVMVILVNTTGLRSVLWLRVLFGISALNFTLRAAVPLILGALSGILCERTGIINIGIEGMMLAGAYAAFTAKVATNHWPLLTSLLLCGAAAFVVGGLLGLLLAILSIRFRVNQIISGTAIIILAAGFTTYLFDRDALAEGKFNSVAIPGLADIPVVGEILFNNPPITYLAL